MSEFQADSDCSDYAEYAAPSKNIEPTLPNYTLEDPDVENVQRRIDSTFARLEAAMLEIAELRSNLAVLLTQRETQTRYELECAKRNFDFIQSQKEKLRLLSLQVPPSLQAKTQGQVIFSNVTAIPAVKAQQHTHTVSLDSLFHLYEDTSPNLKPKPIHVPAAVTPPSSHSDSNTNNDTTLTEEETAVDHVAEHQLQLARVEHLLEVRAKIELWNQRIQQETMPLSSIAAGDRVHTAHRGASDEVKIDVVDMLQKARQARRQHEEYRKRTSLRSRADRKARSYGCEREMQELGVTEEEAVGKTRGLRTLSLLTDCRHERPGWYRHRGTFSYQRHNPLDQTILEIPAGSTGTGEDHDSSFESPATL